MITYLLVWNPAKWTFHDWPQALKDFSVQGYYVREWSCISKKPIPGDAVLLKKAGKGLTGIIASGVVLSPPYDNRHWGKNKNGISKRYIQVKFDRVADYTKGEILRVKDKFDFGFVPQASGCVLNPDKAEKLMLRFHDYVLAPDIAPVVFNSEKKKRIGLSLGLRYEILDRDAHTCRYCGRSSPAVELHVDHIISQASWRARFGSLRGGQAISGFQYVDVNDRRNLITSCSDCNLGKSAKDGKPPER